MAEMTTDELKALLRECREHADKRHFHYGVIKNGEKVEKIECSGGVCELFTKIDAALSSDFAVVPRKITKEMSDALNAMAQCEGFIEEGYNDMIKVAEKK